MEKFTSLSALSQKGEQRAQAAINKVRSAKNSNVRGASQKVRVIRKKSRRKLKQTDAAKLARYHYAMRTPEQVEKDRAARKAYYEKNKAKIIAASKKYYEANKERILAERAKAVGKAYKKVNKAKAAAGKSALRKNASAKAKSGSNRRGSRAGSVKNQQGFKHEKAA